MAKRIDFYPPRPNPAVIKFATWMLPWALHRWCGVCEVDIPGPDMARLAEATSQRCIIAPNHPSRVEPVIVGDLARRVKRSFYFVSARENFELGWGRILPSLGVYSIARGLPDRASLAMTRSLLAEQDRQVVLFPEGEIYHHNDLMLPLNPGVVQIGFWALADIAKLGKPALLPILPIAVKYRYEGNVEPYTARRIARLEKAVGVAVGSGDWRSRVLAIGGTIVETLEKRYRLGHDGELTARIERLKHCIIERGFVVLGLESRAETSSTAEQMRALFNAVREFKTEIDSPASEYDQKILNQRSPQVEMVLADLNRVADSILASGHYVSDRPTFERLNELLGRMEDEVFGKHARYPRRVALVRIGEPLRLETMAADYAKDKRATVAAATAEIASRIAGMLEELVAEGNPLPEALWPRADMVGRLA
jgi:1-acyl-sn-glycerol-3-phosphate acyltransferase